MLAVLLAFLCSSSLNFNHLLADLQLIPINKMKRCNVKWSEVPWLTHELENKVNLNRY
jgi:hypothetical protein